MEKLNRILVLDGDPIATFISQEVFSHVKPGLTVVYLTGIAESLTYLQQTYPMNMLNHEEGLPLLLLGQTLDSLEFLKQLYACEETNCDKFYIVVHIRFFRLAELERINKYNINAHYTDALSAPLIEKIILDCKLSQFSGRLTV